MDNHIVDLLASVDLQHWMYKVRSSIVRDLLQGNEILPGDGMSILDVGCGPGGFTTELSKYGGVTVIEPSQAARKWIRQRLPEAEYLNGTIEALDRVIRQRTFDLVTCFHVLYHSNVKDPEGAVGCLARHVKPGGLLLLEEPADERLRRSMDILDSGVRRFRIEQLQAWVERTGLVPIRATYIHGWAWPIGRLLSVTQRGRSPNASPIEMRRWPLVDSMAKWLSVFEWKLGGLGLRPMCGLGCLVAARKPWREDYPSFE